MKTALLAGAALWALAAAPAWAQGPASGPVPAPADTAIVRRIVTPEALVTATRANERTATAYTNLNKQDLAKQNFGQDLPYLLNQTPSVVVNSDAGAGVGYTDIRIRGTGNTGINTTINGVPLNDPESHGAFLVDLPDLASSVSSLQVQRGVGTSQNGGAAFGASLNISTLDNRREAYAETQNSYGSYQTWKNNVAFGTGLLNDRFTVDGRLSRIASEGYLNRAASDLKSYYFAAGYQQPHTRLKFITFAGREKTYQAWNGVPEPALSGDRARLQVFVDNGELSEADAARVLAEGRRFGYYTYGNQTDNYQQNHYQLHLAQGLGRSWNVGAALHLTRGFGYYESYRTGQKLADYGLPDVVIGRDTLTKTNLVDRKWLDNNFWGGTLALNYEPGSGKLHATLGGAWNRYDGDHYGEIVWAQYASNSQPGQRYYFNNAAKTDYHAYARATWQVLDRLGIYADVQVRHLDYRIDGREPKNQDVTTRACYTFFNPKAGATLTLGKGQQLYGSFAVGQREPVRTDFTDRPAGGPPAQAERLEDFEGGYRLARTGLALLGPNGALRLEANGFYMRYRNQLVATGQLNDVGTALRTNVARSYRRGVELSAFVSANDRISLSSTLTLSQNRILDYQDVTYDASYEPVLATPRTSTISYSPAVVSAHTLEGQPLKGLRVALLLKTVSRQYLDNSRNDYRSINPYQTLDLRLRYTLHPSFMQEMELGLLVNNLLNRQYVANGYTYTYQGVGGQPTTFNWFYPQATRHYLASVGLKF